MQQQVVRVMYEGTPVGHAVVKANGEVSVNLSDTGQFAEGALELFVEEKLFEEIRIVVNLKPTPQPQLFFTDALDGGE